MKINHQRNFKDKGSFRDRSMTQWSSRLSGAKAWIGNDFTNGHRGHAYAVHGAKAHIRHIDRQFLKCEIQQLMPDLDE
jgi:hypothetical protein